MALRVCRGCGCIMKTTKFGTKCEKCKQVKNIKYALDEYRRGGKK